MRELTRPPSSGFQSFISFVLQWNLSTRGSCFAKSTLTTCFFIFFDQRSEHRSFVDLWRLLTRTWSGRANSMVRFMLEKEAGFSRDCRILEK